MMRCVCVCMRACVCVGLICISIYIYIYIYIYMYILSHLKQFALTLDCALPNYQLKQSPKHHWLVLSVLCIMYTICCVTYAVFSVVEYFHP